MKCYGSIVFFCLFHCCYTQSIYDPAPSPTPTPVDPAFGTSQPFEEILPLDIESHTILTPWDFSFSYQPCACTNASSINCTDSNRTDPLYPTFTDPDCSLYTRMGGSLNIIPFSSALHHGTHHGGSSGIGDGDVIWEYPKISYLAEDRVRYTDYTQTYPTYTSQANPIPPEVLNASFGAQVITGYPAAVKIVSEKPLVRWTLNSLAFDVPWSYVIEIYTKFNDTSPHIRFPPSPVPSPSPNPSPSPSPSPFPSPSPAPSEYIPTPVTNPDFDFEPKAVPLPPLPSHSWSLVKSSTNSLSRDIGLSELSPEDYVDRGLMEEKKLEICNASIADGSALGNAIMTTITPSSEQWSLRCQKTNRESTDSDTEDEGDNTPRIIIRVKERSASCKVMYIQGDPEIIAKVVVTGDFGEPAEVNPSSAWTSGLDPSAPFGQSSTTKKRKIVIPNLFVNTPIAYDPSLNRSSEVDDIEFPAHELNDPRVFTEVGYDPQSGDPLLWRVIQANALPEAPEEVLRAMFPNVQGGAILSCDLPEELPPGTSPPEFLLFKDILHVSADGKVVWFFVPNEVVHWYLGTHSGSEISGLSSQLGVKSLHILHDIQQRLEGGINSQGEDGAFEYMPDFCSGKDIQFARDEIDAQDGIDEGRYDGSRPFLYSRNLTDWLSIHHIPALPGVCSIAERLISEDSPVAEGTRLFQHQLNLRYLESRTTLQTMYSIVYDLGSPFRLYESSNPHTSSRVISTDEVPLYPEQYKDWFVDGSYLYKRITDEDIRDAYQQATMDNVNMMPRLSALFSRFEENLIINLLVDISDTLMSYVGSTSFGFFQRAAKCLWYIDTFALNDTITGSISNIVCAPSFIDPEADLVEGVNGQTEVVYELSFQCDSNFTLLDGDLQFTPPIRPGECLEIRSEYTYGWDDGDALPPASNETDGRQYVFSVGCDIYLLSALNPDNNPNTQVYDMTVSRCSATYDGICSNLGICPLKKSGRFGPFLYAVMGVIGLIAFLGLFYLISKCRKKKREETITVPRAPQ